MNLFEEELSPEEIEEANRREAEMPQHVVDVAEALLELLEELPEGEDARTSAYVEPACARLGVTEEPTFDELFGVDFIVRRRAAAHGLELDGSAYAGMVMGLPFNIPYVVRHV